MGGLAVIARQMGHQVSGSDQNVYPPMSTQLQEQGIELMNGYQPENLDGEPDLVIIGNALSRGNSEVEAPIPGKSLVGIEIPNKSKSIVGLATLLSDDKFQNSPKPLTIALGRNISGKAVFGNLAKMPHCLVAGTTGSGKSVTIHSMITSLLYRNGPDDLKLILIDPKASSRLDCRY